MVESGPQTGRRAIITAYSYLLSVAALILDNIHRCMHVGAYLTPVHIFHILLTLFAFIFKGMRKMTNINMPGKHIDYIKTQSLVFLCTLSIFPLPTFSRFLSNRRKPIFEGLFDSLSIILSGFINSTSTRNQGKMLCKDSLHFFKQLCCTTVKSFHEGFYYFTICK